MPLTRKTVSIPLSKVAGVTVNSELNDVPVLPSLPTGTTLCTLVAAIVTDTELLRYFREFVQSCCAQQPNAINVPHNIIFGVFCEAPELLEGVNSLRSVIEQNGWKLSVYSDEMSEFELYKRLVAESEIARQENTWVSLVCGFDLVGPTRDDIANLTMLSLHQELGLSNVAGFDVGLSINSAPQRNGRGQNYVPDRVLQKLAKRNFFFRGTILTEFFTWATDALLQIAFPWMHVFKFIDQVRHETRRLCHSPNYGMVGPEEWTYFYRPEISFVDHPLPCLVVENMKEGELSAYEPLFEMIISSVHRYMGMYPDPDDFLRGLWHGLNQKNCVTKEELLRLYPALLEYTILYMQEVEAAFPPIYLGSTVSLADKVREDFNDE